MARVELQDKLRRMRDTLKRVDSMATRLTDERNAQPGWATGKGGSKKNSLMCLSCSREMTAEQVNTLHSGDAATLGQSLRSANRRARARTPAYPPPTRGCRSSSPPLPVAAARAAAPSRSA